MHWLPFVILIASGLAFGVAAWRADSPPAPPRRGWYLAMALGCVLLVVALILHFTYRGAPTIHWGGQVWDRIAGAMASVWRPVDAVGRSIRDGFDATWQLRTGVVFLAIAFLFQVYIPWSNPQSFSDLAVYEMSALALGFTAVICIQQAQTTKREERQDERGE